MELFLEQTATQFQLSNILLAIQSANIIYQKTKMDAFYSYIKLNTKHNKNMEVIDFVNNLTFVRNNLTNATTHEWEKCVVSGALAIDKNRNFQDLISDLAASLGVTGA